MSILYSTKRKCTFSLSTHETLAKIGHMLAHKGNLNKFQKAQIEQALFSDHNTIKQKINGKSSDQQIQTLKFNNTLLKNSGSERKPRPRLQIL